MLGSRGCVIRSAWVAGGLGSERATQRRAELCWAGVVTQVKKGDP